MDSFLKLIKDWSFENLPGKLMGLLPQLFSFAAIMVIGFWIANKAGEVAVKILARHKVDNSIYRFLQRSVMFLIKIVVVIIALEQLGIQVASFVAALGAAGIAAGLGLQNSIAQFASGVQILFNKPFKSGDYVEIDGVKGKVKEIRFMYTTLVTNDNKVVIVPNLNVTTKNLINYSDQGVIRIDFLYYISYNDDIDKAKKVLVNVALSSSNVIKNPKPVVGVCEHGSSGIGISLFAWCDSDNYWETYFQIQEDVKKAFDKNGITIPYDQLDVHIDNQK